MAEAMEPVLYEAGADLVLSGHVHSYERSAPIYEGKVRGGGEAWLAACVVIPGSRCVYLHVSCGVWGCVRLAACAAGCAAAMALW
jgi:hypothetical protein